MIDFLHIFEATPAPLIVFDPEEFRILALNGAALAVTGGSREALVGKKFDEAFPVDPDDPRSFDNQRQRLSALTQVRETGETVIVPALRYAIRNPDTGEFEEKYWAFSDTPIHDESGRLLYILHRADDITDVMHFGQAEVGCGDDGLREARGAWLAAEVLRYADALSLSLIHI